MHPKVQENIIKILKEVIALIKKGSLIEELRDKSNSTIHSASIYQDQDSIIIAILIYSLYKLLSKGECSADLKNKILVHLESMLEGLSKSNLRLYNAELKKLTSLIKKIDQKYGANVGEILLKAKIVKGALMFKHGLSISFVAHLLNISKWDLMTYIGKTKYTEVIETINVKNRIDYLTQITG